MVVVITALAVRLLMLVWTYTGPYVVGENPMARSYIARGYAIAAGWGYVRDDGLSGAQALDNLAAQVKVGGFTARPESMGPRPDGLIPEMLHPPGLPLLVAGLHRILGGSVDLAVQLIGLFLDVAAAGVIFWIVARLFPPRIALLAGLAYGLFLPVAYASVSKMPDGMMSLFVAGALALALLAAGAKGLRSGLLFVAYGAAVGLGSYLRPDYACLPAALFLGLWAFSGKFTKSFGGAALAQAMVLAVLFPWAWRNHSISGRWIFTSTSTGATLICGLGEFNNPWGFGYTDQDRAREATQAGFDSPWSPDADLYFQGVFWRSIGEQPMAYAKAVIRRLPMALAPPLSWGFANPLKTKTFAELRQGGADRYQVAKSQWKYVLGAHWDVLLISLAGMAGSAGAILMLLVGPNRGAAVFVLIPHVYGAGSHMLTHMEPRYILPSMFCSMIALGWLLGRGWRRESHGI